MRFIPNEFTPPGSTQSGSFLLRPITIHDVDKDYIAVMGSRDHIWNRFGEEWGWPPADLTHEQDLIDLAWHQKEAQLGSTFNYAIMSLDESALLGCVYLDPPLNSDIEAEVCYWCIEELYLQGFEEELERFLRMWLINKWPFHVVKLNGTALNLEKFSK